MCIYPHLPLVFSCTHERLLSTHSRYRAGTSSVKVGVFAGDGRLLSFARRAYGLVQVAGEAAEQDPEQWWTCTAAAIHEAINRRDELAQGVRRVRTERENEWLDLFRPVREFFQHSDHGLA